MRRRFVSSVAAAGLAATLFSSSVAVAAAAAPPAPRTYVALGDSLAVGTGATHPKLMGYVANVFRMAQARRAGAVNQLHNLAVGGETSSSFISGGQLTLAVAAIRDPASDVRLVTLDIGGNDFLGLLQPGQPCGADPSTPQCQAAVGAALSAFPANYVAILTGITDALRADPGDERLLVMTYYNPFSGTGNVPYERAVDAALLGSDGRIDCAALPSSDARVGLNDLIACIGAGFGATIVDVQPTFANRAPFLTHIDEGDIHPTNAGHLVLAQGFGRVLLSIRD